MSNLLNESMFASPTRLNWRGVSNLNDIIVFPEPTEDDLHEAECSVEHLIADGYSVPTDDDEAYNFAVKTFMNSPSASNEWKEQFIPQMTVFWPCDVNPDLDAKDVANLIYSNGLSCVLVSGEIDGLIEVKGFALTGGGMDFSDHIAAAYICAGQNPPLSILERAIEKNNPKMESDLKSSAEEAGGYLHNVMTKINLFVSNDLNLKL